MTDEELQELTEEEQSLLEEIAMLSLIFWLMAQQKKAQADGFTFEQFKQSIYDSSKQSAPDLKGIEPQGVSETPSVGGVADKKPVLQPVDLQDGFKQKLIKSQAIQTAAQAGRFDAQKLMALNTDKKWLRYNAINDDRTRPHHKAMDGFVAPAFSPVWAIWYPPNGYNCRCTVESVGVDDYINAKTTIPTGAPDIGFETSPDAYLQSLRVLSQSQPV